MSEPYIGEIRALPYPFAPRDWAWCNGQLISITQQTVLFAIIGTNYGGDGRTNFALPNLKARAAIHYGQGPGLTNRRLGSTGGSYQIPLSTSQIPDHTHQLYGNSDAGTTKNAKGNFFASQRGNFYEDTATNLGDMSNDTIHSNGSGGAHENRQPFQIINYCICMEGLFPPRS